MVQKYYFFLLVGSLILSCSQNPQQLSLAEYEPLSDEEKRSAAHALDGIEVMDPELELTLFASEPLLTNPTNMDIDAKGRVWVCEGYNYRNILNPRNPYNPKGDRILILEDTDEDGKADKTTVFYQGEDVNTALGIAVLGNKVIVSSSPNVFLFTDENEDGVADKKDTLFTGLRGHQDDHGIHAFSFGPDGKLYFNFGNTCDGLNDKWGNPVKDDLGRKIDAGGNPYRQGMVFRCDVDGSNVEILGHNFRNIYEVTVDAFGRLWQSDNDDDGNKATRINFILEHGNYGYKDELTGADWRARRTNMESTIPEQHWHLNDPGVVPNLLITGAGSPSGMLVYEGDLLPNKYHNLIIHCDPGPGVIRAYPVEKSGAGFTAGILKILDGAQRDKWFRPSDLTVAPDGSLFVCDWYDPGVGGHAMGDSLRGRIYRVAPKGSRYTKSAFNFNTVQGSMEGLKNPNLAVRYLAWTALHQAGAESEGLLKEMWQSGNARHRARALWLLGKIPGKQETYIQEALTDADEDIRVAGLRLLRQTNLAKEALLRQAAADSSAHVRREVALSLYHDTSAYAKEIWNQLAQSYDGKDRWYLEALGIAADNQWDDFMTHWLSTAGDAWRTEKPAQDIIWRSRSAVTAPMLASLATGTPAGEREKYFRSFDFLPGSARTAGLLGVLNQEPVSDDLALLILKHLDPVSVTSSPVVQSLLPKVLEHTPKLTDYFDLVHKYGLKTQNKRLLELAMAFPDSSAGREAVRLLVDNHGAADFAALLKAKDMEKTLRAIKIFGTTDHPAVVAQMQKVVLDTKADPGLREAALHTMNRGNGEQAIWNLIEVGKLPADFIEIVKPKLLRTWNREIRKAAIEKFGLPEVPAGDMAESMQLKGNPVAGKSHFESYCQMCHKINFVGNDFGPDLSQIGAKLSKEAMFTSIMDPDAGINFGYEGYDFQLKNGKAQGIIASETADELLLKVPGVAEPMKINPAEIVSKEKLKKSTMTKYPLKPQELADIVAYLMERK